MIIPILPVGLLLGIAGLLVAIDEDSKKLKLQEKAEEVADVLYRNRFQFSPENRKLIEEWYAKIRQRR